MLRFAQIVKENDLTEYMDTADSIIEESIKIIESHEEQWINVSSTEGYYIFPKDSPFYLDGVEIPINEAAIFGSALVRLYSLTKQNVWINRALKMWNRWRNSFALDEFGYITYPYVTGDWRNGWTELDAV